MKTDKQILIIEDDKDDCELMVETMAKINLQANLHFAENGLEALEYLYELKQAQLPLPGLIILDLNMPYLDGKETYQKIKSDPQFSHIPIIVFTSSASPYDKALFNDLDVEFISKPSDFAKMQELVAHMIEVSESNHTG